MRRARAREAALFGLLLVGCEDPLKPAQVLEETRVLGVRLAAPGDRASLDPGQTTELEVLLAGPDGMPAGARLAFELCESAEAERGVPFCASPALAGGSVDLDGSAVAIDVPASVTPGAALVLLGAVCLGSEPQLAESPMDWGCSDGAELLRFSFDPRVTSDDFVNLNPDLSELSVTAGGVALPLDATTRPPACDAETPVLDAEQARHFELSLGEAAREPASGSTPSESLQLSHFASAGVWERHYSFVEPGQALATSLGFTAPSGGGPVKQYLVVRDGRGGVSWASFSFCVE
ncbi:MAG TPA: hypothetical protein VJN18_19985 [Polyangiaceae bacterium]|nr:hypothetical protein [Polyangiaceae bacterium]